MKWPVVCGLTSSKKKFTIYSMKLFQLHPVKTPDGDIKVREVYYNKHGKICLIEMSIERPYDEEYEKCLDILEDFYPPVRNGLYNPEIIDYDPANQTLAEWEL